MGGVRHTTSASDSTGLFYHRHRLLPMFVMQVKGGSMLWQAPIDGCLQGASM